MRTSGGDSRESERNGSCGVTAVSNYMTRGERPDEVQRVRRQHCLTSLGQKIEQQATDGARGTQIVAAGWRTVPENSDRRFGMGGCQPNAPGSGAWN